MSTPVSLFDRVDVAEVERAASASRHPTAPLLAVLRDPAVADDRVVLGGRTFPSPGPGWVLAPRGRALAIAYGMAMACRPLPHPGHTWCLLTEAACEDGRTWEAALLAGRHCLGGLVAVVVAADGALAADTFQVAGWSVLHAPAADVWALLGTLDQARAHTRRPTVVVAETT